MTELDVTWGPALVRAIPVVNPAVLTPILAGPARLFGWSFRESGAETGLQAEGQLLSPGAGATIAQIPNVPVGLYAVSWEVQLIGAAAAADQDNFNLNAGATVLEVSLNAGAAGQYPQTGAQFQNPVSQTFTVKSVGAGTVGVTYAAQLALTPVIAGQAILELRDGNSPLAEITAGIAGSLTQWLGPQGVAIFNSIQVNPVAGAMAGAVFAGYDR